MNNAELAQAPVSGIEIDPRCADPLRPDVHLVDATPRRALVVLELGDGGRWTAGRISSYRVERRGRQRRYWHAQQVGRCGRSRRWFNKRSQAIGWLLRKAHRSWA